MLLTRGLALRGRSTEMTKVYYKSTVTDFTFVREFDDENEAMALARDKATKKVPGESCRLYENVEVVTDGSVTKLNKYGLTVR